MTRNIQHEYEKDHTVRETQAEYITENTQALIPMNDDFNESEDFNEILHKSPTFANLTTYEKRFVVESLDDFMSGNIRTHQEIADDIGCNRDTLRKLKLRGAASHVISELLPDIAKYDSPQALAKIRKAIDEDWRAGKFYLEFTGQYVQKSQQAVLHANMTDMSGNVNSPGQIMDRIVIQFAGLGYDIERLVTEIREKWQELKANGQI